MSANNKQKLELTWIGKGEEPILEPRILIEDPSKSYGDKNTENMLIHGDNLLALKALEQDFSGKIKCIYIDPPYNTGSAFEHYDDNLEHSMWLNLMKPRLELLRELLRDDGIIFVQIDDLEMAYLKVLMDEVFGRNNFVNMLVIETGEVFGTKAAHLDKTFVKVKDYILVYFKDNLKRSKIKTLYTKTPEVFDSHYGVYLSDTLEKSSLTDFLKSLKWVEELFNKYDFKISLNNISKIMDLDERFKDFINLKISKNIFQDQPFSKNLDDEVLKKFEHQKIVNLDGVYLFKTSSGTIRYYQSFFDAVHRTSDYNSEICRSTARGDLWKNYHIDMRNINGEGGVKFKSSKKPERLIKDILYTYTDKDDLVLDSFLGSGTTAAVAHKIGRKYIGIEMGEHAYTHCKTRLDEIIDGSDQDSVTKNVNWVGGGYKFYELAPSLLKKDKFGNWIIDDKYNGDMLAAAMAKQEGFKYHPNEQIFWKQARSSERDFLFTTTQFLTLEMLDVIHDEMQPEESLLIACKAYHDDCVNKYPNITIKKIPQILLGRCEFGKDDYSLNIIDIPTEDTEEIETDEDPEGEVITKKTRVKKVDSKQQTLL